MASGCCIVSSPLPQSLFPSFALALSYRQSLSGESVYF